MGLYRDKDFNPPDGDHNRSFSKHRFKCSLGLLVHFIKLLPDNTDAFIRLPKTFSWVLKPLTHEMVRRKTASATAREQVKLFRLIKSRRKTAWLYPFGYDNKETAHFNGYTVVVYWPNYRVKHFIFRRRFLCNVDVSSFSISCSLYFPQCSVVPQIIAPKLFCFLSVTGP